MDASIFKKMRVKPCSAIFFSPIIGDKVSYMSAGTSLELLGELHG